MSDIADLILEAEATPIDEDIKALAKLKLHEYQTVRPKAAERLGLKLGALDEAVKEMRRELTNDKAVETESYFEEVEPYDGVVDTKALLNEIREVVNDYLFLPPFADVIITLWIAHTHIYECFRYSSRLVFTSVDPESGKSRGLDVIEPLVPKPLLAHNITTSAFCRVVEEYRPTLLLDEYDTYMKKNEDIRGIINAGQRFNGKHWKCVGENHKPTAFACYCPVAMAGIGKLHPTIWSRSHIIKMKPAKPFEIKKDFDEDDLDHVKLLASKLARWSLDNQDVLKNAKPKLHKSLKNRKKDSWKPFYAIAELGGDKWIDLANCTVEAMPKGRSLTFKERLLADIRYLFERDNLEQISSLSFEVDSEKFEGLTNRLNKLELRGYTNMNDGNGINSNNVAKWLEDYEIKPKQLDFYIDSKRIQKRGYTKNMFKDAWERHLDCNAEYENLGKVVPFSSESPNQPVTPSHVNAGAGFKPNQSVTNKTDVTLENDRKGNGANGCDTVTLSNDLNGLKDIFEAATEGYYISAQELFEQFDEADLQNVRDGILSLDNLRTVAKDCQRNIL